MDIRPILSTLGRHKTAALLIILEITLTCAILCNALDLIAKRMALIHRTTGMAETELVMINITGISQDASPDVLTRQDLAALREVPGVKSVTTTNQVPYGSSSWNTGVQLEPGQQRNTLTASQYLVGERFIETTGLRLVAGRDFRPDEYVNETEDAAGTAQPVASVLVNRAMAERLFPNASALGKTVYLDKQGSTIVGIVEQLSAVRDMNPDAPAMMMPVRMAYSRGGRYLLRTDPGQRQAVLAAAVKALEKNSSSRVLLDRKTLDEIKERYFEQDKAMAWLLVAVCVALLVITALGIVGLASFWVQQRTRMIGIRRALGATRAQILRYFQIENFLLTSVGIALGMAGAYGISLVLMRHYELPRLPVIYLPAGALALWLLGQLAVLGPALRAAAVPPVVATRSA